MRYHWIKKAVMPFGVMVIAFAMFFGPAATAFAQEAETTYVLTYPNGDVIKTTDKAKADELAKKWKRVHVGKTDENGEIVLEGWDGEGQIVVREKEIPDGYTAKSKNTITDLAKGSVTIVNTRKTAVNKASNSASKSAAGKTSTAKQSRSAKTGDVFDPGVHTALLLFALAAITGGVGFRKRRDD